MVRTLLTCFTEFFLFYSLLAKPSNTTATTFSSNTYLITILKFFCIIDRETSRELKADVTECLELMGGIYVKATPPFHSYNALPLRRARARQFRGRFGKIFHVDARASSDLAILIPAQLSSRWEMIPL